VIFYKKNEGKRVRNKGDVELVVGNDEHAMFDIKGHDDDSLGRRLT
jgi:hypothetical protein